MTKIIKQSPTAESVREKTRAIITARGYSHIWNDTDYNHHMKQYANQVRKSTGSGAIHKGWAAIEVAALMLREADPDTCQLKEYFYIND